MYCTTMSPSERTLSIQSAMADALADAWQKGERALVKGTIEGGPNSETTQQWMDATVAALPAAEREKFLAYMRD